MEKSKNERNEGARELCAILAHNVKELRKRKTLSQEKLSEITGLSVNEIGRIERNKTITGLGVLHALAKGLDISPERPVGPPIGSGGRSFIRLFAPVPTGGNARGPAGGGTAVYSAGSWLSGRPLPAAASKSG